MSDSRLAQWRAMLDDVRCEMADMAEEGVTSDQLHAARCSINVTLRYLHMLERELGCYTA